MRWNCPHCGTALAVSDDKLTASWSFSKCFQCNGYALVRRSDLNMIRIDQVPQGQAIIQSQAAAPKIPTSSLPLMNRAATDQLQQAYARIGAAVNAATDSVSSDDKPVIRPAARRTQRQPEAQQAMSVGAASPASKALPQRPAQFATAPQVANGAQSIAATKAANIIAANNATTVAASPVIEAPASTGTGAVSAGPAVPVEAAKNPAPPAFRSPAPKAAGATAAGPAEFKFNIPEPLPEVPESTPITRFLPVFIAACSMIAVGSGFYLYRQGQKIYRRSSQHERASLQTRTIPVAETAALDAPPATPTEWSDRVAEKAMAPNRERQAPPAKSSSPAGLKLKAPAAGAVPNTEPVRPNHAATSQAPAPRLADGASVIAHTALTKVVEETAAANRTSDAPSALVVQVHAKNASLRGGPGVGFPIMGIASPNANFVVSEWQGQWFKIVIPQRDSNSPKTAWIRNDLVRLITVD